MIANGFTRRSFVLHRQKLLVGCSALFCFVLDINPSIHPSILGVGRANDENRTLKEATWLPFAITLEALKRFVGPSSSICNERLLVGFKFGLN